MHRGLSAADPTAGFERPAVLRRRSGPTVRLPVPTPENIERAAEVARTKRAETQKPVPRANQARRLALIETLWATGIETDEALGASIGTSHSCRAVRCTRLAALAVRWMSQVTLLRPANLSAVFQVIGHRPRLN